MSDGRIVEVEWVDSISGSQWEEDFKPQEWRDETLMRSVGYVVYEDDEYLMLAQSEKRKKGSSKAGIMAIPRVAITNVTDVHA